MKRFLISFVLLLAILFTVDYYYFYDGDLYLPKTGRVQCISYADKDAMYLEQNPGRKRTEIRGVNLGAGKPGHFAADQAITDAEYLRWFQQIQAMGANVIRINTIGSPVFYRTFYRYNLHNPEPLYLIQGVWADEYLQGTVHSALDKAFFRPFLESCKDMVDIVHGRFKQSDQPGILPGYYKYDVSPWVFAYILGAGWDGDMVVFTDECVPQVPQFEGKYLYTENASNFEIFLARVGNQTISYETGKYKTQRPVAFGNQAQTCPLPLSPKNCYINKKIGSVDTEHIRRKNAFRAGLFASYSAHPCNPEYLLFEEGGENIRNSYLEFLKKLTAHHSTPVVISEFGIPTSRGLSSYEENRNLARDQGRMDENKQGKALVSIYEDILEAGCAGGMVFSWQDEWFRSSWNTISTVNLDHAPFWSDLQTYGQHFGLLKFEPGQAERPCSIDGDPEEWTLGQKIWSSQKYTLSMQYDFEGIYLLIQKNGLHLGKDTIYVPIDVTPNSGAKESRDPHLRMSDPADFILKLQGIKNSRLLTHERYDTVKALHGAVLTRYFNPFTDAPDKDGSHFEKIVLPLQEQRFMFYDSYFQKDVEVGYPAYDVVDGQNYYMVSRSYEAGLLHYGNGNPKSRNFDSLADFCAGPDCVEIRLPWQILNFSDPSGMMIHDDYYENYGVDSIVIRSIKLGVGDGTETIQMTEVPLEPLGKKPVYHERLKRSYYILKNYWNPNS